jgi:hypothetical protein
MSENNHLAQPSCDVIPILAVHHQDLVPPPVTKYMPFRGVSRVQWAELHASHTSALDDAEQLTSWSLPFGTRLRIIHLYHWTVSSQCTWLDLNPSSNTEPATFVSKFMVEGLVWAAAICSYGHETPWIRFEGKYSPLSHCFTLVLAFLAYITACLPQSSLLFYPENWDTTFLPNAGA